MNGSEKIPLMVIGKFERPRCFKSVKTRPVDCKFNKKAWMTSVIFAEWLRRLDRRFKSQRRKVLMIVDNCSAHPQVEKLDAIKLVFLPPNSTSRLQPCDMGIIKNLKVTYRRLIEAVENKTVFDVNVLDAMHMLRKTWAGVTQQTIVNCFRKAGFQNDTQSQDEPAVDIDNNEGFDEEDDLPLSRLLPDGVTFDEYATVDDAVETCELPTDDDIVADILSSSN